MSVVPLRAVSSSSRDHLAASRCSRLSCGSAMEERRLAQLESDGSGPHAGEADSGDVDCCASSRGTRSKPHADACEPEGDERGGSFSVPVSGVPPPSAPSAPAAPPPPAAPFSLPLAVLAALAGFSGLLVGGTSPASLELAAQISYPVPEGLSANLITNVLTQSFTIVFLAVLQGPLPDTASTAAICLGFGLCLLALLPVRERYHRLDAERSRLLDVAQGSSTPPPAAATAADPSSYLSPTHLPCQPVAAPSQ
mmetsp:Transcript_28098/g.75964  ORF Transcript_28098/g.75964 Transcript_28098/m.75964 type:complete len:253 (-) Transcript_28098:593-1351(-)